MKKKFLKFIINLLYKNKMKKYLIAITGGDSKFVGVVSFETPEQFTAFIDFLTANGFKTTYVPQP